MQVSVNQARMILVELHGAIERLDNQLGPGGAALTEAQREIAACKEELQGWWQAIVDDIKQRPIVPVTIPDAAVEWLQENATWLKAQLKGWVEEAEDPRKPPTLSP